MKGLVCTFQGSEDQQRPLVLCIIFKASVPFLFGLRSRPFWPTCLTLIFLLLTTPRFSSEKCLHGLELRLTFYCPLKSVGCEKMTCQYGKILVMTLFFICSQTFNFISSVNPRFFWNIQFFKEILLNARVCMSNFLVLRLYTTCCACLVKSALKIIFHWKTKLLLTVKSLLKVVALAWMSLTTEKTILGKNLISWGLSILLII